MTVMKKAERSDARNSGRPRYFTGQPCPKGHVAERYASKGSCVECTRIARQRQNSDVANAQDRARRLKNPEKARANDRLARQRNPAGIRESARRWRISHPAYEADRRKENLQVRLAYHLRNRFKAALKSRARAGSAVRDLGCTIPELIMWMESLFSPGMTWENYGHWHIDHRRPLSSFDLTERHQVLVACNWQNLQPLWAVDNLRKGHRT